MACVCIRHCRVTNQTTFHEMQYFIVNNGTTLLLSSSHLMPAFVSPPFAPSVLPDTLHLQTLRPTSVLTCHTLLSLCVWCVTAEQRDICNM